MRVVFLFSVLFFYSFAFAQNAEDAYSAKLREKIKSASTDTAKARLMNELSLHLTYQDNEEAERLATEALALSKKNKNRKGEMFSLFSLSNVFSFRGKLDIAVDYALTSLRIAEELKDTAGIGDANNSLGLIYQLKNEHKKANGYFLEAVKILEKTPHKGNLARSMNNAGNSFFNLGDMESASHYFETALVIRKELGNLSAIADTYNDLGNVYYTKGETDKALSYYLECHSIKEKINDLEGISFSALNIAVVYKEKHEFVTAKKYFEKALRFAREVNGIELMLHCYQSLADLSYREKNYKTAYEYFKQYDVVKDSLLNQESSRAIAEMEVRYKTEKKEKEILKLQKKKAEAEKKEALRQAEAEKERAQRIEEEEKTKIFQIAVVGLLIIAGIIFYISIQRKKTNVLLSQQNTEIKEQKHVIEEKNKEILDSINYARRLQEAILPPQKIVKEYLNDSFILYKPKDIVAGDFYFLEPFSDKIIFAAADCTGHGVPGAMVSVVCSNALNRTVKEFGITMAGEILNKVRELVTETFSKSESEVKDGMDISLCVLDLKKNELLWSGANNPLWIIRKNSSVVEEIKPDKQPIGKYANPRPFSTHSFVLNSGDSFYIFTDGYADQFGGEAGSKPGGKKFKTSRLKETLLNINHLSMDEQVKIINDTFENWKGDMEQIDDVCVIGVRI